MIVVRLQGGLGNQMFQYAYGCALAHRGRKVVFDRSSYATDTLRDYELDVWQTEVPTLPASQLGRLPKRYGGNGKLAWLRGQRPLSLRTEKPLGFHARWNQPADNTYLSGYWQSEAFFKNCSGLLRQHFQPRQPLARPARQMLAEIEAGNSVAVHVRRTDYLQLPEMQVCDEQYHRRCVQQLLESEGPMTAFVFSDEPAWCRDHLGLPCDTRVVDDNVTGDAWQQLWLMSRCRHHVIPNSTFSWWAAWLKPDPTGKTFAPDRWWNDPTKSDAGIVPAEWIKMPGRAATRRAA